MSLGYKTPENCCTAWEINKDYGISRQKTIKAIKSGKLNGFMLGTKEKIILKWYIEQDALFHDFIAENRKF